MGKGRTTNLLDMSKPFNPIKKPVTTNRAAGKNSRIPEEVKKKLVADWRTGEFTKPELATKYGVSEKSAYNLTEGIGKDLEPVLQQQMQVFKALAGLDADEQELIYNTALAKAQTVDLVHYGMTKTAAYLINKVNLTASVNELVGVTQGLKNVRDVVDPVPKQQTNIQFNQTTNLEKSVRDMSDSELKQKVDELFNRVKVINL